MVLYRFRVDCIKLLNSFPQRSRWLAKTRPLTTASQSNQHGKVGEDTDCIRNIGIMAHIDAGKTTTTERMLYYSGFSRHLGDVDDGDTVTDYMTEERDRGITITSAAVTFKWNKHKINLIDTPGHVDFTVEVERALRVLDGAVAVLDASPGVEAQTLTVWRQADRHNIPRIVFLNKMDKFRASLDRSLKSLQDKLHVETLLLNIPIGIEKTFSGVVDLITMEKLTWDSRQSSDGVEYHVTPLSQSDSDLYHRCVTARTSLIGQLADLDDSIAELVLSDAKIEEISAHDIRQALRRITLSGKAVAVLCGSALKNKGIQPLLDAVVHYLPNPNDIKHDFLRYYKSNLCALVFKIIHTPARGALTFLRLYSGTLKTAATVYNVNRNCSEKVTRLIQVNANMYKDIREIGPGNIVCVSGFHEARTGDTITSSIKVAKAAANLYKDDPAAQSSNTTEAFDSEEDSEEENTVLEEDGTFQIDKSVLAGLEVPPPVFFCSIEAESMSKQRELDLALACLQREDPSLSVEVNEETSQTIISGMGELHIDIVKSRLLHEYNVEAYLGTLQVAYREMISKPCEHSETLDVTVGDRRHCVSMLLSLHPNTDNKSFKKVSVVKRMEDEQEEQIQHISWKHLKAVNIGVAAGLRHGPILHTPVTNIEVQIHKFHVRPGSSLPMITACATQCVMKALKQADCILLEPIMRLEVNTDEEHISTVLANLAQRRANVEEILNHLDTRVVKCLTPLSELMGYSTSLRTITSGTATFTMQLSHYEELTPNEKNKAIERVSGFLPV